MQLLFSFVSDQIKSSFTFQYKVREECAADCFPVEMTAQSPSSNSVKLLTLKINPKQNIIVMRVFGLPISIWNYQHKCVCGTDSAMYL